MAEDLTSPTPDLAPGLPSRIVTGKSTIITERGPVKGGTITFSLSQAILSVPDGVYLEASSVEVPMDSHEDGSWAVRLPTVGSNVEPAGSWTITVKYSTRPYAFQIRVPAGTDPIDISQIGEVHGVAPEHAGWVVTGMQIGTVTSGTTAGAKIRGEAPTLTLDLTLPQGAKGDKGATGGTGPANSLSIGPVTTAPAGAAATASITGTAPAQTLALTIPQGVKGEKGDIGPGIAVKGQKTATSDLPATGTLGDGWLIGTDLHVWTGSAWQNVGPIRGPKGDPGGTGVQGASVTKIEQPTPTSMRVTVTDPAGGASTSALVLPVAAASYTEVAPDVWEPSTDTAVAGADQVVVLANRLATLEYDSGWRDVTALFTGGSAGTVLLLRRGPSVWLRFVDYVTADQANTWATWSAAIPTGFRVDAPGFTIFPTAVQSSAYTAGPLRTDRSGTVLVYGMAGGKKLSGLFTWPTSPSVVPGALPGTAAT